MSSGRPRGQIFQFPRTEPWAPPSWRPVRVGRIEASPAGLRQLERLVLRFVRRGWRLLRALDELPGMDMEEIEDGPILSLLALDGAWLDLLCNLARFEVGPGDIQRIAEDVRRLGREQTLLRKSIYGDLGPNARERVAAGEQAQTVGEHEVRQAVVDMLVVLDDVDDEDELEPEDEDFRDPPVQGEPSASLTDVNAARREEWEARPLPPRLGLRGCLRVLPVEWLDAITERYRVAPVRRRSDRESTLFAVLQDRDALRGAILALPRRALDTLRWLLDSGGVVRTRDATARFGSDLQDGLFWRDHPPRSNLGQLRALGIVYVGTLHLERRPCRAALIPVEMRPHVAAILADVRSGPAPEA